MEHSPILLSETECSLQRSDFTSRVLRYAPEQPRSPGLHLSGLLRYVAVTSCMTEFQQQLDQDILETRMALGLLWEELCVSLYPEILWQPGEVHSPLIMTCDGLSESVASTYPYCKVEEFKLTWCKRLTGAEFVRRRWAWIQQGAGYCLGYGASHVRWHVCWVNGDWRPPKPVYVQYLVYFPPEFLRDTKRMIDENRKDAIAAGYEEGREQKGVSTGVVMEKADTEIEMETE